MMPQEHTSAAANATTMMSVQAPVATGVTLRFAEDALKVPVARRCHGFARKRVRERAIRVVRADARQVYRRLLDLLGAQAGEQDDEHHHRQDGADPQVAHR